MSSLKGKVALVTGAGSIRGIGRAVAQKLAGEGADIVVADRVIAPRSVWPGEENWRGLEAVVEEIEAAGQEGLAVTGDVSSSKDVDNIVAKALEKFGKIDILVHCAGIIGSTGSSLVETDEEAWKRVINVNLTGSFLTCKAVARTMIPDPEGKKIVIIASVAGTFGAPGNGSYCSSKYGVIGLAKTLALELAQYKINVNAINPENIITNIMDERTMSAAEKEGITITDLLKRRAGGPPMSSRIPLGRMAESREVADLVYFLVSEQSGYITGQAINIDGGGTH